MNRTQNLQIIERLLKLAKNSIGGDGIMPLRYDKEYIFLANILNHALVNLENKFNDRFKYCVSIYKMNLKESKNKYGWFHKPEELIWTNMQINQLKFAIYGESLTRELVFVKELKEAAYLDLINQIDPTVLMTPKELEKHTKECNKIALDILNEILAEEKQNKK